VALSREGERNGETLEREHGTPIRLRVETQPGFKMVDYLRSIEFTEDYREIGLGEGGREDCRYYSREAGI